MPIHVLAKRACIGMAVGLCFAVAGVVAGDEVRLPLAEGEYISAQSISDAGEAMLVLTNEEATASRLLLAGAGMEDRTIPIPDQAINRLEPLDGEDVQLIFASGLARTEGGSEYVSRLYRLRGDREPWVELVWSSEQVGAPGEDEQVAFFASRDGKFWARLEVVSDEKILIAVGRFPATEPGIELSIESPDPEGQVGRFHTTEFPDLEVISQGDGPPLLALAWQGEIQLLTAEHGPARARTSLAGAQGAVGLRWEPSTRSLWTHDGSGWVRLGVPPDLPRESTPRRLVPDRRLAGSHAAFQLFPLENGRLLAAERGQEGVRLVGYRPEQTPEQALLAPPNAVVEVSPAGRYALVLPAGPVSRRVLIERLAELPR